MEQSVNITFDGEDLRFRANYKLDNAGAVEVSVVLPNENFTLLEMHAQACEAVVESLSRQAASFRRQIASTQASPPAAE